MKKTLLSVAAGLAVVGAANAGIKETCLEHPDKLVWVEKTQRCIPINPCKSDDKEIHDAYCVDWGFCAPVVTDKQLKLWLSKWIRSDVIEIKRLGLNENGAETVGAKTADGYYFAYWCAAEDERDWGCALVADKVAEAYNHDTARYYLSAEDKQIVEQGGMIDNQNKYIYAENEAKCVEIKEFAEALFEQQYDVKYEDNKCIFLCDWRPDK